MPPFRTRLTRRSFLRGGAGAAAYLGAGLTACADEETIPASDAALDSTADAGADGISDVAADTAADALADSSADAGVDSQPDADTGAPDDASADSDATPAAPTAIVKGPWPIVTGAAEVTLALETTAAAAVVVEYRGPDVEAWTPLTLDAITENVGFRWPTSEALTADIPDLPGDYTIHRGPMAVATAGGTYEWRVLEGGAETAKGSFVAPRAAGEEFTFAWISDTMTPNSGRVSQLLQGESFDLLLHGGDVQYRSALIDTWNGFFATFAPVMRRAPMMFAIGNHEFEANDESGDITDPEYDATYRRLFEQQGEPSGNTEYYAFTWGGVRFFFLNSEDQYFGADGSQMSWFRNQVEAANADPAIRFSVVCFHRPYWTLSNSRPSVSDRAYLHPILQANGVKLVLTGHNHCYEHFVVDGIHYMVDGGGGALLYSPDDNLASIEADRPGESSYRLKKSQSYGTSLVTVRTDGSLLYVRRNVDGVEEDRFEIA
jgi:predicted phosphodiesterase